MGIEVPQMNILQIIATIFFGGSSILTIVTQGLYIIGLWKIFEKSDIKGWWALLPWFREYQLGKCAGKEPEGRAIGITAFLVCVTEIAGSFIKNEYVILFVAVFEIMAGIINIVYSIQVYTGLIEVYNVRKRWLWLWILAEPIPALIWGFSDKYKPSWKAGEFRDNAVTHVKGGDVADMGEGLTVNLDKREVADGLFQKKTLLKDIHMNIKPGRLVMLLGGSGAGKTTYVNAINGYEKADAKVMLNGRNVYKEYAKMQYECGFVPQSDLMRGKDTVLHTLNDYAQMRLPSNFTSKDRKDRVEEALTIFGLGPVRNSMVSQLSGGQRKRLSIAMEFLSNPSLLILDEPDSGVDGVMAKELFKQMRKVADTGRIVIAITHTPDRVIDMFDDVIILAKDSDRTGRLAFYGTVDECRKFFGKERMEDIVKCINRPEEGGDGHADEFIIKYAQEVQHV
ncbi:MAG: ABC transporter ATP-binding protein [Flexilinea sp.]|nr:ABC transporter ATP-binding protein [Flexilinea sp.]